MEGREPARPSFREVGPGKDRSRKNIILNGKYIVGEEIGKGASGLVRKKAHRLPGPFAILNATRPLGGG